MVSQFNPINKALTIMKGPEITPKTNSLTRDFNKEVEALNQQGITNQQIIEKLRWNKSMFSLVRNGQKNVPVRKYELLKEVFHLQTHENEFSVPEEFYRERVQELKERVEELRQYNVALREHNQQLQIRVLSSLDSATRNQLTHAASSEAKLERILKLFAEHLSLSYPEIEKAVDSDFVQKRLELAQKGSLA